MPNRFLPACALACALASTAATAEDKPVAGEVAEGALAGRTMTFVSWGGIYQDAQMKALEEFAAKSGVTLLGDGPTEVAKLQAQVESGNVTWDVVDTADFTPYVHCGTLFQKLDLSRLDTSKVPADQIGPCSVPAVNYGVILMFKKETYGDNPPASWADFFDTEKFPGLRGVDGTGDAPAGLIEQAALAAGKNPGEMTLADVDAALDEFRALGPDTIYYKSGAESQQLMEAGEVDMIAMWSGRAMAAVKNGAEYEAVWGDWIVAMDQLAIPVGVKDLDASYALINFYLGRKPQETISEMTSYSPVNTDATPDVDEVTAAFMPTTPERMAAGYLVNIPFWVANMDAANEKMAALLSGN